jgi:hypothetical protein
MKPITRLLAITEVLSTALWTGASAGFAFFSAPLAFSLVKDRDVFAVLTEQSLSRITTMANVVGSLAVVAAAFRKAPARAGCGVAALALLNYHQKAVMPEMERAQRAMGSFNDVPENDPRRVAYRAMHQTSTRVFGAALLFGVVQLAMAAMADDK